MTTLKNIIHHNVQQKLDSNEIYYSYNLLSGHSYTSAIQAKGQIITHPTSVKLGNDGLLILWGVASNEGHFIEMAHIAATTQALTSFILSDALSGIDSDLAIKSLEKDLFLAWTNQEKAVETIQFSVNDDQVEIIKTEQIDFATPIENTQIEIIALPDNNAAILFQTFDDGFYSWAVKTSEAETIIQTDTHLGMGSWAVDPSGNLIGTTEVLDEGKENHLSLITIDDHLNQNQQYIKADSNIIEAQWPKITTVENSFDLLFSARHENGEHQAYRVQAPLDNFDTDTFSFTPFTDTHQSPIIVENINYHNISAFDGIIYELTQNENLSSLGIALNHLADQTSNSLEEFIRIDYDTDTFARIIQIDENGQGNFSDTYTLYHQDVSQSVLDFFDYIHTDFVI